MDPAHFISLLPGMAPSRVGQTTPLPQGLGGTLSPMMIPLATSDTALSSFSGVQPTISMIQTTAGLPQGQIMFPQTLAPPPDLPVSVPAPVQPQVPPVNLYKCTTGATSDVTYETSERTKEKASLDLLQKAQTDLNSRNIKTPLSSFLPDIPGEFDSSEPPGTMLLDLVENKPIGGKEFLPLSGQALLGFRLLPGPLPEQFRIDPPSVNDHSKPRKKRKHKHKNIDRTEDKSDNFPVVSKQSKLPTDAYSFIKHEPHTSSFIVPTAETVLMGGGVGGVVSTAQILQQQAYASGGAAAHISGAAQVLGEKKKKKKRDKEKKKKDHKKKRRHHTQDPPGHPPHPLPHTHPTPPPPSSTTAHFPHSLS